MAIDPTSRFGFPKPIPSSELPVRLAKPPSLPREAEPTRSAVQLSREAQEANPSESRLRLKLFAEVTTPKSLALSQAAQDMSVSTYKFLKRMYPELEAREALSRGMKDLCPSSHEHCLRVADLAFRLAREMDLAPDELESLERELEDSAELKEAGILALSVSAMSDDELESFLEKAEQAGEFHDIGKLSIPAEILDKPGPLTDEEFEVVKLHPLVEETMLTPLGLDEEVLAAVRGHHENWDGTGYPDGLRGSDIPVTARILSIVDSFDAMTAGRPYRSTLTYRQAADEILENAGSQFDPFMAEMFAGLVHNLEGGASDDTL